VAGASAERFEGIEAMAFPRFRVRSAVRNRETDRGRMARIHQFLNDLTAEMERERDGLRGRYDKVAADAAFSQQALEDDGARTGLSARIDGMTETMIRYRQRIAALEKQIDFVTGLDRQVERFPLEGEGSKTAAAYHAGHDERPRRLAAAPP
jgi:hypothetical protein